MKKTNKKRLFRKQKAGEKRNKTSIRQKRKKQILQIMREHNKIKYRSLPGLQGKYPYQLTPWTFEQTEYFMKTGIDPIKGVNLKMVKVITKTGTVADVLDETGAHVDFTVEEAPEVVADAPVETTPVEETPAVEETPVVTEEVTPTETPTETPVTEEATPVVEEVTGHAEVELSNGETVEIDVTEHPTA